MNQARRRHEQARIDGLAAEDPAGWGAVADQVRWGRGLAAHLRAACEVFDISAEEALTELKEILFGLSFEPVLAGLRGEPRGDGGPELGDIDGLLMQEYRQRKGAFMTPPRGARALVKLVDEPGAGPIIDPACGHGELLLASRERWPERSVVGVELHGGLAMGAALRLWAQGRLRGEGPGAVKILVGDGLARLPKEVGREGSFALVIGNPPFVGEKGQAKYFQALRERYPRFEQIYSPRMDLLYLFLARGVELARPGGQQAWLTPPYWMSADGARGLRAFLGEHVEGRYFVELREPDLFLASPGEELALTVLRRTPVEDAGEEGDGRWFQGGLEELEGAERGSWKRVAPGLLEPSGWRPFTPESVVRWRQELIRGGTALSELLVDHQGFVSGADRVTRRHLSLLDEGQVELGEPIFLAQGPSPPVDWEGAPAGWVRPVLRSRELRPNRVFYEPPQSAWALYIDNEVSDSGDEALFEELLGRFRPVLERRREVQRGVMPWYRLHWPRDRRVMEGPKLVVPRRAGQPYFSLDLSGAMVSSDCTFLVAPEGVVDEKRYLAALMLLLNSPQTDRLLRYFGKRKGRLLEFYSTPLRQIIVPARLSRGQLLLDEEVFDEEAQREFSAQVSQLFEPAPV